MAEPLIPIIKKAFDLTVAVYGYVDRFPRAHKALLGREILRLALQLVVSLVAANHHANKVLGLRESSATLDALRITLRLAKHASAFRLSRDLLAEHDVRNIGKRLLAKMLGST